MKKTFKKLLALTICFFIHVNVGATPEIKASTAILVDAGTYALERLVLGQRLPSISKQLRTYGLDLPFNRKQE